MANPVKKIKDRMPSSQEQAIMEHINNALVEIYKNKMVSERSEFHFVISTISSSAPEPGRFLLFLLFLFFYGNKEKRMTILVPLQKRTSPPWGG
jgi:hypothetical protein